MKWHVLVASFVAVSLLVACAPSASSRTDAPASGDVATNRRTSAEAEQTPEIVPAATALLATLSADQRSKVQFPFTAETKASSTAFKGGGGRMEFIGEKYGQAVWSNYPVSDVPRPVLGPGHAGEKILLEG